MFWVEIQEIVADWNNYYNNYKTCVGNIVKSDQWCNFLSTKISLLLEDTEEFSKPQYPRKEPRKNKSEILKKLQQLDKEAKEQGEEEEVEEDKEADDQEEVESEEEDGSYDNSTNMEKEEKEEATKRDGRRRKK